MSGLLRNALAGGLLALASVVLSLCAGEGVVRGLDAWRTRRDPTLLDELTALARDARVGPDTFNVYYLGESSMVGVPYDPRMSIPQLVEHFFGGAIGGRAIRSVNLARSGENLAFNAERFDLVLAQAEVFHPGLVVIYLGHNEFGGLNRPHWIDRHGGPVWQRWLGHSFLFEQIETHSSARYPLDFDSRALFDQPTGSAASIEDVYVRFEARLGALVDAARAQGVPVVLATETSNFADFEPSRSVYCGPPGRRDEFAALLDRALAAERAGLDDDAIAELGEARAICDRFAELEFRRGRILERRGDRDGAAAAYRSAVDSDGTPLRAGTRINDAIRRVGAARGLTVVDAEARFAALGPRPVPGDETFVDAHHPNAPAYVRLAHDIAEQIRATLGVARPLAELAPDAAVAHFHLDDPDFVFEKWIERGRWFTRIATWRFDPADRLAHASAAFAEAAAMKPFAGAPHLGLAMVAFVRRDPATGERELAEARRLDAAATEAYLQTPWVRAVIERGRVASGGAAGHHAGPGASEADGHGGAGAVR